MPRQARTISATNVYHAILRGVNKQQVFEDDEDLSAPMSCLCLLSDGQPCISPSQGRIFSSLTGVPYSMVQRPTSDAVRYGSMVCESLPRDEEFETYIDDSAYEKYPEYSHLLRASGTCPSDP